MSQEIKEASARRCYACIQWEGQRSYDTVKKLIKVDAGKEGNCLVHHKKVKGSHYCEQFFPLR